MADAVVVVLVHSIETSDVCCALPVSKTDLGKRHGTSPISDEVVCDNYKKVNFRSLVSRENTWIVVWVDKK